MPEISLAVLAKPALKAFANTIRELTDQNNVAANKEFQAAVESMVLEMYPSWNDESTDELPTTADFINRARDLEAEYEHARDNRKRELLNRAFLGCFSPRFYKQGVTRMLNDWIAAVNRSPRCA